MDAGASCSELSALNHVDIGRHCAIQIALGTPRERIARLSPGGIADCNVYLEQRRDLFGFGSDALFASARGSRERLPIRSIANIIQSQIDALGLGSMCRRGSKFDGSKCTGLVVHLKLTRNRFYMAH